jgi:hypothetical protein
LLEFVGRLDHLNSDIYEIESGKTVVNGTNLYFTYSQCTTSRQPSSQRIFFRALDTTNDSLGTQVDVSGAVGVGATSPDMVRLTDGTLVLGYQAGKSDDAIPNISYIVESSDNGTTWTASYSSTYPKVTFGLKLHGLYADGQTAYAIYKKPATYGGHIVILKRTGVASWTGHMAWKGDGGKSYYKLTNFPPMSAAFHGNYGCIVGYKINESAEDYNLYALHSDSMNLSLPSWSETKIISSNSTSKDGRTMILRGNDGILRCVYPEYNATKQAYAIGMAASPTFGAAWTTIGAPDSFFNDDSYEDQIIWPSVGFEVVSFALDGASQWWISSPQYDESNQDRIHIYKGIGNFSHGFSYHSTTAIDDGAGSPVSLNWDAISYPSSSCFVGASLYRIVPHWSLINNRCELWILKYPDLGMSNTNPSAGGSGSSRYMNVD